MAVAAGSSRIGPTFPLVGWKEDGERIVTGWQAVVAVDARPVAVWDDYVDALGIGDRASAAQACTVSRRGALEVEVAEPDPNGVDRDGPTRFLTEPAIRGEDRLTCSATFDRVDLVMIVGQDGCGTVRGSEVPPACRDHEVAHLLIQVQTGEVDALRSIDGSLGTDELRYERTDHERNDGGRVSVPSGKVVAPQLGAAQPSELPEPGERIDGGLDRFLDDGDDPSGGVVAVPDGGWSLVAPAMLGFCNSGLVAVVGLPGAPPEAVAQLGLRGEVMSSPADETGPASAFVAADEPGGYGLALMAVAQPDGTSAVLVSECGD